MRPRTDEILLSLLWTFEKHIAPEVQSDYAKSLTLTMGNLIDHVRLRVRHEGELMYEERAEIRRLLSVIAAFARSISGPEWATLVQAIEDALQGTASGAAYLSTIRLTEQLTVLRAALSRALVQLQDGRPNLESLPDYRRIRADIRQHLARTLDREGSLIEPAFVRDRR